MNNYKNKVWPIVAGIIFALTAIGTVGLMMKVAGLNMLPSKYFGLAIFAVVFLLALIFAFFFLLPWKKKEDKAENTETAENTAKKPVAKYVLRTIAMILAIALACVDVVGMQMIHKFEETMSNLSQGDDDVKVEEFTVGVYVLAEDKAESLEDAKRYSFGYSLGYDRNNTRKAISVMQEELNRTLDLEEYDSIPAMVDAVLAGEKDAFILSASYMTVLEDQEGYTDIASKVKCIHECVVTIETEIVEREEENFDITKDPFVVYISGQDVTFRATHVRSDVNILAVVNPSTKQVLLINTPRDYYVPISESASGELDKLTHCGIYGIECSMDTLNDFYDIDIKHYAQINFTGFIRLIDAVGGISVYCEKDISTDDGYTFVKGMNSLNGDQALRFVRERKLFEDGDHARGRHQMAVIKGLIAKMSSGSLLKNYDDVLDSMGRYFKTSLKQEEMSALVKMQIEDMAEWNVQSFAVDGTGKMMPTYSVPDANAYVIVPNESVVDHAKTLIQMVYDGKVITKEDLVIPVESEVEDTESVEGTEIEK